MTATVTKIDRTIDRRGLRQAIGLTDKIPAEFGNQIYANVACPTFAGYYLAKLRAVPEPTDRQLDSIADLADRQQVVAVLDVWVAPSPKLDRKSSQHRVFVICPCCQTYVPAGRFQQHTKQVGAEIVCRRGGKPLPTECRGDYPAAE